MQLDIRHDYYLCLCILVKIILVITETMVGILRTKKKFFLKITGDYTSYSNAQFLMSSCTIYHVVIQGFYEEIKKQIKEELYEEIKAQVRKELLSEEMNKRWFDLATVYFKDIDFFDRPNANGEFGYIGMTSFINKVGQNSAFGPYDSVDYNKIEREFLKKAKGLNFRMP